MNLGSFSEQRETYLLGLLRICFAILLFGQLGRRAIELYRFGYFGHVWHLPLLPESFVPSAPGYAALLGLALFGCLLSALGVLARPALFGAAVIGLYCFFCDRLQYHNNRYQLLLLATLVAVTPCDRSFSLARRLGLSRARRAPVGPGPRWAVRLVAAQVSLVYLASGLGKLLDADWREGTVLLLRFTATRGRIEQFVPVSVADLVTQPWFAHAASLSAISSELFLALGLWFPRTRALALWVGVMFHVGIELTAHVELFSYTMLCGYLVFVTPELRERSLSWNTARPLGRRLSALFARLDLLARFHHASAPTTHPLLVVRDRHGRQHQGLAAWRELARAMPPLFPLWLPLALLSLKRPR